MVCAFPFVSNHHPESCCRRDSAGTEPHQCRGWRWCPLTPKQTAYIWPCLLCPSMGKAHFNKTGIPLGSFEVTPPLLYQRSQHLVNTKLLRICPQGMNIGDRIIREVKVKQAGAEARPVSIAASEAAGEEVFHFLSCACPISVWTDGNIVQCFNIICLSRAKILISAAQADAPQSRAVTGAWCVLKWDTAKPLTSV